MTASFIAQQQCEGGQPAAHVTSYHMYSLLGMVHPTMLDLDGFLCANERDEQTEESIFPLLWLACSPLTLSDSFLLHDSEAPGLEGYMARATLPSW